MMNQNEKSFILIVDDSLANLQVLGTMLKDNGFNVVAAKNGFEALDFVKKKQPDLILLDIMMPEMDGFETCMKLKQKDATKNIPIIFITALAKTADKLKAFEVGGVDYIFRPFVEEEVLARVDVHLKLKKAMEKLELLSVKDELTGVFNRRFALEVLDKKIEIAKREKENIVICYLDIDNLKKVNDSFGHVEGDRLINTVIQALGETFRTSDYIFRMGGDEFLLILPKMKLEDSANLIKRIKQKLLKKTIRGVPIDFSSGFAEFHYDDKISVHELIEKADAKMYEEKLKKKQKKKAEPK